MSRSSYLKIFSLVLLLCTIIQAAHAQARYAAFIHGFSFGDDRPVGVKEAEMCQPREEIQPNGAIYKKNNPFKQENCNDAWEESGARWDSSGTPGRWVNSGPLDDSITLKYFDRDLYYRAGGKVRDKTVDDSREEMMRRFVHQMKYKMEMEGTPNAEWVLVGHSQGGIVARLLEKYINTHSAGIDVEGVLAVASPMQGAKPTTVAYGDKSGYKNIGPSVEKFMESLATGPAATTGSLAGRTLELVGSIANDLRVTVALSNTGRGIRLAASVFDLESEGVEYLSNLAAEKFNEMAVQKDAKSAIGPDGKLIREINQAEDPDNYRALLGAERKPLVRALSGFPKKPIQPYVSFLPVVKDGSPELGGNPLKVLYGDEAFRPGDEAQLVTFWNDTKKLYSVTADLYRYKCYAGAVNVLLAAECAFGAYQKFQKWKQGREALQNFASLQSQVLNSTRLDRRQRQKQVCDHYGSGMKNRTLDGNAFSPPSPHEHVNGELKPSDCKWVTETYYVSVPNKSDALLGTATTTWDPPPSKGGEPNLGTHSILYNDRPSSNQYKRGGTGYNHAEMVYDKRRYSASDVPGIADGEFSEGQRNPPMEEAQDWVEEIFGGLR